MQTANAPQEFLRALTGQWQGTTRTWFEADKLADESPWQGNLYTILGDRFVQYDYTGSIQGDALEGKATLSYNTTTQEFEMAWVDSFHQSNGIMYCKGRPAADNTDKIVVLGSSPEGPDGPMWGWRTEFQLLDADHLTIRAYIITPQGEEGLAVETVYTRR